jgi:hypothetical protein
VYPANPRLTSRKAQRHGFSDVRAHRPLDHYIDLLLQEILQGDFLLPVHCLLSIYHHEITYKYFFIVDFSGAQAVKMLRTIVLAIA